jgi:uncharacterized protein
MSEPNSIVGTIGWIDLTVEHAKQVKDFYQAVTGWQPTPLDMGGYSDFVMSDPLNKNPVAGVCHARGGNASLPPVWLIYINVADLENSIASCVALGGQVIAEPREYGGHGKYCIIRDPAGAYAALFEPTQPTVSE